MKAAGRPTKPTNFYRLIARISFLLCAKASTVKIAPVRLISDGSSSLSDWMELVVFVDLLEYFNFFKILFKNLKKNKKLIGQLQEDTFENVSRYSHLG